MRAGWLLRAGAVVAALVLLGVSAPPAAAHAAYRDSDPPNRSQIAAPPETVWAEFTEPPNNTSWLRIYDPCGARVDHGDSSVSGYRITVSMTGDKAGTYRVAWSVVSTLDGHPTSGEFTFTSSGGDRCPGSGGGGDGSSSEQPSGGGSSKTSSGTSSAPAPRAAPAPSSDEPSASGPSGKKARPGRAGKSGKRAAGPKQKKQQRDRGGPATEVLDGEPILAQEPVQQGDIPVSGLLVSFGIAALIGAAGGQVYAQIVGPRRRK